MNRINILDDLTINKIAAGEVVERPSSVVKELIENSVDAGSTKVVIDIQDGGKKLIRITDNGCGIASSEVDKSFLRHATSKIKNIDDLYDLYSLGFRGEALASISAVSKLEMVTKTKDGPIGTKVIVEGGHIVSKEPVGAHNGTTIIIKDISMRIQKIDISLLNRIVKFMFDSVGSMLSINNIANKLTSSGYKIDNKTVSKYLKLLTDSMLFYKVERYNVKGKNILSSLEKYYAVDIGIRNIKLGRRYSDLGHIIENIVFLELIRRKYEVYIGFIQDGEIDFAAFKNGNIEYYQVTLSLIDKNVMERETKSLKNIHDNYPKYILTLDKIGTNTNIDGIRHINLIDWLLEMY